MIKGKIKVIIDTNLFIKASMSDLEYENIMYLIQLAKKNKIHFLIFEIVIDELAKYSSNLESTLQVEISKASPDAINIPLQDIQYRLSEFPKDKDLLIYCRSGKRSQTASSILINKGFTRVFNIEGGIMALPQK